MKRSLTHMQHASALSAEASQILQEEEPEQRSPLVKAIALAALCLGYFMVVLDTTIVNVALPTLQQQLGASLSELQWVVAGYLVVFASFLLTGGVLSDRLGKKPMFLVGFVIFTLASVLCGVAPTIVVLQTARVVQGVGAALLVPSSLALIRSTFLAPQERAKAIGIWGGIGGLAGLAGPVVGGILITSFGWRSVFLVNGPVGVLGFGLTFLFVAAPRRLPKRGLDLAAQAAGIVALGTLTFAFVQAGSWGWGSWPIGGTLIGFVLATITFLALERHSSSPMLPLGLFGVPTFSAANTVGILLNFGFLGQLFVINLFFQQILGYAPLFAGLALVPETGVFVIGSILAGKVTGHLGPRLPMVMGLLLGCVGFFAMSQVQTTTSYAFLCVILIAIGFGTSFTMPAMTAAVMEAAPKEQSGIAAAVLNAGRQVGSALGVALLGSLVSNRSLFVPGMHLALIIAGGAFLIGCLLTLLFVGGRPKVSQDTGREEKRSGERVPAGGSSELPESE